MAFLPGAIAVTWRNLSMHINTLVERIPPAMRRVVTVVASLASIGIITVVTVASFRLVSLLQSMDQRSDALNAPSWLPQSFVTDRARPDGIDDAWRGS